MKFLYRRKTVIRILKTLLYVGVILTIGILCTSCTENMSVTTGGGSDLPNGVTAALSGEFYTSDSLPVKNGKIVLSQIEITAKGDTIKMQFVTKSDSMGHFKFDSLPKGNYSLYMEDSIQGLNAFVQSFKYDSMGSSVGKVIGFRPTKITGYLSNFESCSSRIVVCIPGMYNDTVTNSNGQYTLNNVPRGTLHLAFIQNGTVNYSKVTIPVMDDTLFYMRDYQFSSFRISAVDTSRLFESSLERNYYIEPRSYYPGQEPSWYQNVNLSAITYYTRDTSGMERQWRHNEPPRMTIDTILVGNAKYDSTNQIIFVTVSGETFNLVNNERSRALTTSSQVMTIAVTRKFDSFGNTVYQVMEFRMLRQ